MQNSYNICSPFFPLLVRAVVHGIVGTKDLQSKAALSLAPQHTAAFVNIPLRFGATLSLLVVIKRHTVRAPCTRFPAPPSVEMLPWKVTTHTVYNEINCAFSQSVLIIHIIVLLQTRAVSQTAVICLPPEGGSVRMMLHATWKGARVETDFQGSNAARRQVVAGIPPVGQSNLLLSLFYGYSVTKLSIPRWKKKSIYICQYMQIRYILHLDISTWREICLIIINTKRIRLVHGQS